MTKHTPTPWKVGSFGVIHSGVSPTVDVPQHGRLTCSENDGIAYKEIAKMVDWQNQKENAAFIVRAVNAHEELLGLLKEMAERIQTCSDCNGSGHYRESIDACETCGGSGKDFPPTINCFIGEIEQAIAKAEGE